MPQSWQNGVTAYYAFNPLLVDATLRGNTLTQDPLNYHPVTQVAGIVSQAASFDGGNDLFAANSTDTAPAGSFTIALWCKLASLPSSGQGVWLLADADPLNGNGFGFNLSIEPIGGGSSEILFEIWPSSTLDPGGSVGVVYA